MLSLLTLLLCLRLLRDDVRVSEELGERGPGTDRSLCGYQIRFEARRCATTRLTYCTTGVLLRRLQQDPNLSDVSCVIVDEVGLLCLRI